MTNWTLLKIIKAKLDDARTPIGETPIRLTYGTKAVIPVEVGVASIRREVLHEEDNDNDDQL